MAEESMVLVRGLGTRFVTGRRRRGCTGSRRSGGVSSLGGWRCRWRAHFGDDSGGDVRRGREPEHILVGHHDQAGLTLGGQTSGDGFHFVAKNLNLLKSNPLPSLYGNLFVALDVLLDFLHGLLQFAALFFGGGKAEFGL